MLKHNKVRSTKSISQINREKNISNNIFKSSLFILASIALFTSIFIVLYIFIVGLDGISQVWNNGDWLIGNKYDGMVYFAAGFMVVNTLWTSFLAVIIALPISVLTAIFITRVAPRNLRSIFFVVLSILAAIPSVIYGTFGSKAIDSIIMILFHTNSGSLLTIVVTLAFMIMPTITLITVSSINSVDDKMEKSSLALGATRNQTSFHITIRAASTGILTATILGVGRALGEATAVSMISTDPYTGPTFDLFSNIRLLTATMLKGYNEMSPGSIQEASMFAMAILLVLTILIVFLTLRYAQKISSPEYKSKVATDSLRKEKKLYLDVKEKGVKNLSVKEQKLYHRLESNHKMNEEYDEYYHAKYRKQRIIRNTTIKSSFESKKQRRSNALGALTWVMASIGVIFLVSIILFLLVLGTPGLYWEFISTNDPGVRTSLFGTLILILLSMLFVVPVGVGSGIYFAVYARKDSKITKALMIGIDILSGIPSLIFGIIGATIFLPLSKAIGFIPLAGAIISSLIVLPTVIQTTQHAIKSVPNSTINGSLALGSTKATSSLRVALPIAMPQILSGIILSIGRIIGESAAIIMIFGTVSRGSTADWLQSGGTTLATEMYRLTLMEEIPWDQVAAIGVIILSLILILSLLSNYISMKNNIGMIGILISLALLIIGIFIGYLFGLIIFLLGVVALFTTIFIASGVKR